MMAGERTALIGDIGGTHARFAISDVDEMSVRHFAVFQTSMFSSLQDAIRHYLDSIPQQPAMAGFSLAAPMTDDEVAMTYLPWRFNREEIRQACGAERIHFVNDFEALAMSLPYLNPHDLQQIGGGEPVRDAPKAVLGAGSGFGIAGLVPRGDDWLPVAGEGGLASFGAMDERELELLAHTVGDDGLVSRRAALSARGMQAMHSALGKADGGAPAPAMTATEIVNAATKDEDPQAERTLECYAEFLARAAGDVALLYGARGGVYLGGGIPPKILKTLQAPPFREAFESKGRARDYLNDVPLYVITANDAGLRGAALAVSDAFPM